MSFRTGLMLLVAADASHSRPPAKIHGRRFHFETSCRKINTIAPTREHVDPQGAATKLPKTLPKKRHDAVPEQTEDTAISFGPFRLLPKARLLERDGAPVHIGGRALDILIALAERAGEVVGKRELVE